ncbi:hypothetical protein HNQ57_002628 [Zhongshania antarctica]|uniref:Uncharacterized protein n=1 Tax=Zhongshania antarctica TaxID=641702 RepID=A0A840R784_9GAMM|nr:hypothetical protein [Zhongshania antarctica]
MLSVAVFLTVLPDGLLLTFAALFYSLGAKP